MERPKLEVADVFRRYGEAYRENHAASLSTGQRRVMTAIELCRTAALGGHMEQCDECGHQRNAFNSCRDRHCPKCQSLARAEWLEDRQSELLDCEYFHVVFTLPEDIAAIAYQNKKVVYDILFRATAETLSTIAADPKHLGAGIGFFAVLHTNLDTPGTKPAPPSAPALRCARRRNRPRRHKMDWLPARLLPAGSCPVATVSAAVSQVSAKGI